VVAPAPRRPGPAAALTGATAVARREPGDAFDPDRGLWTAAGCVGAILLWAAIIASCAHLVRS
jgi:hypothetical protein